jgi:ATP-dependent exoDNAse (exonuclease V) beta subunit
LTRAETFVDLLASRRPEELERLADQATLEFPTGALWRRLEPQAAASGIPVAAALPAAHPAAEPVSADDRRAARRRAGRRRVAPVSSASGVDPTVDPGLAGSRRLALALGTALHRGLERAPLAASDRQRWRLLVTASFAGALGNPSELESSSLSAACERLLQGQLWRRLDGLGESVAARELPLLLSSAAVPGEIEESGAPPLEAYVGILDLLYRDPVDGEWVVADFKTDEVAGDEALTARAQRYRPQLSAYGHAVRQALGLDRMPRLELWYVAADRIEVLAPAR